MEDIPESAEVPAPASRRDWFGIVVSLAALATSAASIFIAVQNADSMERLVEANSWPYLQLDSSNLVDGERVIQLALTNTGVGPLRLESFVIYANDETPLRHIGELIRHSYDPQWTRPPTPQGGGGSGDVGASTYTTTPGGRVLAPGEGILVFGIPYDGRPDGLWAAIDQARFTYRFEACYCSVFDECWRSGLVDSRPEPVARCPDEPSSWRG
ncbi:MAG: hypothetical protein AAGA68_04700 [Pseudomonadota bacterium]